MPFWQDLDAVGKLGAAWEKIVAMAMHKDLVAARGRRGTR
jgi:hypothetical protein